MWNLDEIIKTVNGVPLNINRTIFSDISTDSRTIKNGELFVPLTGKNYDGHQFIDASLSISKAGCLCEKKRKDVVSHIKETVILVDDTVQALLDLARYKRKKTEGQFIAITGSNGKTTTKEILVDMIKRVFSVHYNEKNYNNTIGVSKSILSIKERHQFFVFELGTNSRGEIKQLATITEPDVSTITNINPSHLEGLSDIEGVLKEKLDLFYLTKEGGRIFVNADDPYIMPRYKDINHIVSDYAIENEASYRLLIEKDLGWDGYEILLKFPDTSFKAKTRLLGRHNLYNILSASSIAYSAGIDRPYISEAIENFASYEMRFKPYRSSRGYLVVDDTYNANPSSMEWAIKTVASLPCGGKRIAIIGDMKELGDKTEYYHRKLGRFLKNSGIDMVLLIGEYVVSSFKELTDEGARLFEDKKSLVDYVLKNIDRDDVVLVKGSRALKMDEIVGALF